MVLKEQNNQKKTLTDGVLDMNHEQDSTPSTNGKARPLLSLCLSLIPLCAVSVQDGLGGCDHGAAPALSGCDCV